MVRISACGYIWPALHEECRRYHCGRHREQCAGVRPRANCTSVVASEGVTAPRLLIKFQYWVVWFPSCWANSMRNSHVCCLNNVTYHLWLDECEVRTCTRSPANIFSANANDKIWGWLPPMGHHADRDRSRGCRIYLLPELQGQKGPLRSVFLDDLHLGAFHGWMVAWSILVFSGVICGHWKSQSKNGGLNGKTWENPSTNGGLSIARFDFYAYSDPVYGELMRTPYQIYSLVGIHRAWSLGCA